MKMSGTQLVDFKCLLSMILLCSLVVYINPPVGTVGSSLSDSTSHPLEMLKSREAQR